MPNSHRRPAVAGAIAASLAMLAGCATPSERAGEVVVKPLPSVTESKPLYARVDWVDLDPHAVAARIDGHRHTVGSRAPQHANDAPRSADTGRSSPDDASGVDGKPAETAAPSGASESDTKASGDRRPLASSPGEIAAWRAWCAGKELSDAQVDVMVATRAPTIPDLECDAFRREAWRK